MHIFCLDLFSAREHHQKWTLGNCFHQWQDMNVSVFACQCLPGAAHLYAINVSHECWLKCLCKYNPPKMCCWNKLTDRLQELLNNITLLTYLVSSWNSVLPYWQENNNVITPLFYWYQQMRNELVQLQFSWKNATKLIPTLKMSLGSQTSANTAPLWHQTRSHFGCDGWQFHDRLRTRPCVVQFTILAFSSIIQCVDVERPGNMYYMMELGRKLKCLKFSPPLWLKDNCL